MPDPNVPDSRSSRVDDAGEEDLRAPWSRTDRRIPRRIVRPMVEFLQTESSSGLVLLGATVLALVWANFPWRSTYASFWQTEATLRVGRWSISEDLRHWVNDALMALFFFVVGLEIKRELVTGELRDRRSAMMPALAALGGMAVPAVVYTAINAGGAGVRGWGVPMATDIAFAVGVLAIVGRRLPGSLRTFLLALAIVDDIGAIAVIAIFYSGSVAWGWLGAAGGVVLLIVVLQRAGVRYAVVYVTLGLGVWLATLESGVHATIAGVALGLVTPAVALQRPRAVSREAHRIADETVDDPQPPDADAHLWLRLANVSREVISPLARLEHLLHPWTSFAVVPIFALANAGVRVTGSSLRAAAGSRITLGIVLGLVIGKPVGILVGSWLGTRLGLARVPAGVGWQQVAAVGALAGIGFTVSLFIADLAFVDGGLQETAKVGIIVGSLFAGGISALLIIKSASPANPVPALQDADSSPSA